MNNSRHINSFFYLRVCFRLSYEIWLVLLTSFNQKTILNYVFLRIPIVNFSCVEFNSNFRCIKFNAIECNIFCWNFEHVSYWGMSTFDLNSLSLAQKWIYFSKVRMTLNNKKLYRIRHSVNRLLMVIRQPLENFYWSLVISMGNWNAIVFIVTECNIESAIWRILHFR